MELPLLVSEFVSHNLFERLDEGELHRDLRTNSDQREQHAFVEGHQAFFTNGFAEGMEIALVVLLGLRNHLNLDIFEGKHADDLSPA